MNDADAVILVVSDSSVHVRSSKLKYKSSPLYEYSGFSSSFV